jgi:hypothetical protein
MIDQVSLHTADMAVAKTKHLLAPENAVDSKHESQYMLRKERTSVIHGFHECL